MKNGFVRVRCDDCGHEYLLAFSCKRRHPRLLEDKLLSFRHQKRVVESCPPCFWRIGEWLCREVVKAVPHRHVVLIVPKILRRYLFLLSKAAVKFKPLCMGGS